jgi:hypothetical protein
MKTRVAWISLLALVLAAPAFAANWGDVRDVRYRGSIPAPPRIIFHRQPRMVQVPGLSVFLVAQFERPGYDLFRCDDRYYIYDDDTWYWSSRFDGPFQYCDEREVPQQIFRVPSDSWRSYPRRWSSGPMSRNGGGWGDTRRWNGGSDRGSYDGGSRGDGRGGYGDQGNSRGSGRGGYRDHGDSRGDGRGDDGARGGSRGNGRGQGRGQGRGHGRGNGGGQGRGNGQGNGHGND